MIFATTMTKSFTLDKPKRSEGWAKFQEWNRKWNRILASIFCILCFILLFAIVIVNIIETKEIHMEKSSSTTAVQALNDEYDETILTTMVSLVGENNEAKIKSFSYQPASVNSCTISNCTIECDDNVLESVNSDIARAVQSVSNFECVEIDLRLTNYNSGNTKLYKDWYTLSYPVKNLEIHKSHFQTIDDYAFDGGQFQQTKFLKLTELLSLKNLTENVFAGLNRIKVVHFENFPAIIEIHMGILYPMGDSIETITIHSMPSNILIGNVTGTPYLSSKIVDLQYNSFGDKITKNSFAGLIHVVSLYLRGSKISSLPSGVFDRLTMLEQIHLTNNLLRTIPSGTFDIVVPLKVYLSGNQLDCTCNEGILYLQDFAIRYPDNIYDNITCATPDNVARQLLVAVKIFCPSITSTSDADTNTPDFYFNHTKSESETTTEFDADTTEIMPTTVKPILTTQSLNDIYLNCENHTHVSTAHYVSPIAIVGRSAEFQIIKDSNFDIFIEFVDVYYADVTLLWFTNHTPAESYESEETLEQSNYEGTIEYRCAAHVKARVKIENLRDNTVYIFCIVDQSDGRVLPFNCAAFRVLCNLSSSDIQDTYVDDTWLYKSDKIMVITIISVSMLLAVVSGALIMYCCLRRFPFFIAKKQRKSSRPWISERDEIIEYHTPPNYITPTPARRTTKIEQDRCRSTMNSRRFSETSAGSARSYVSAVTPSPFDIISFRMNNNKQKFRTSTNKPEATYDEARDNILYLEKIPDVPPPLPPHPNRRSNQSNLSSNQSTNSSTTSSDPLCSISYRVQHGPDQSRTNSYA